MKKRLFCMLFAVILLLVLAPAASAAGQANVVDRAALLTEGEETALSERAASLREAYQMDIVLVTVPSLEGKTPARYADDFYDENGYGWGEDASGILFLLSMEGRDWYISTCGAGIDVLTDRGIHQVANDCLPYFGEGDYARGFGAFLDALVPYLDRWKEGEKAPSLLSLMFPCMIFGLAAAAVTVGVMRASMNTKRRQNAAAAYLQKGSFRFSCRQDLFLYSRVSKTRRESSSGGTSTHRSASGRTHGGGGGKF